MSTREALIHAHPHLPHPLTYDAVEDLALRLRADLALAEAVLVELRADEIAVLEARLAALRGKVPPAAAKKRGRKPRAAVPVDPSPEAVEVLAGPEVPEEAATVPCRYCGSPKTPGRPLTLHQLRCAANPDRVLAGRAAGKGIRTASPAPPAPEPAPVALAAPRATTRLPAPVELRPSDRFTCAQCGSSAFAPAITDPSICLRCDAAQKRAAAA